MQNTTELGYLKPVRNMDRSSTPDGQYMIVQDGVDPNNPSMSKSPGLCRRLTSQIDKTLEKMVKDYFMPNARLAFRCTVVLADSPTTDESRSSLQPPNPGNGSTTKVPYTSRIRITRVLEMGSRNGP